MNLGNGYAYVGNNPWTNIDPMGLDAFAPDQARIDSDGDYAYYRLNHSYGEYQLSEGAGDIAESFFGGMTDTPSNSWTNFMDSGFVRGLYTFGLLPDGPNATANGRAGTEAGADAAWELLLAATSGIGAAPRVQSGSVICTAGQTGTRLRYVAEGVWETPAGLRYGADYTFGNRILHVLNHVDDIPMRERPHGVFDAGRSEVLGVIDEAWELFQSGAPGIQFEVQGGGRVLYEIPMGGRIGYVGGMAGAAAGKPDATVLSLVIRGINEVITAFPFNPSIKF